MRTSCATWPSRRPSTLILFQRAVVVPLHSFLLYSPPYSPPFYTDAFYRVYPYEVLGFVNCPSMYAVLSCAAYPDPAKEGTK